MALKIDMMEYFQTCSNKQNNYVILCDFYVIKNVISSLVYVSTSLEFDSSDPTDIRLNLSAISDDLPDELSLNYRNVFL